MGSLRRLFHIWLTALLLMLAQPVLGCIPLTLSSEVIVKSIDIDGAGSAETGKFANFFQADAETALGSTLVPSGIYPVKNIRTGEVKDFKSWVKSTVSDGDW